VDLSKIFWAGILFSNIFIRKYFNLLITLIGIILAIILFIIAFMITKSESGEI